MCTECSKQQGGQWSQNEISKGRVAGNDVRCVLCKMAEVTVGDVAEGKLNRAGNCKVTGNFGQVCSNLYVSTIQHVASRPAASVSPESLSEIHIHNVIPHLLNQNVWGYLNSQCASYSCDTLRNTLCNKKKNPSILAWKILSWKFNSVP